METPEVETTVETPEVETTVETPEVETTVETVIDNESNDSKSIEE
ncbi:MAG: hypothetical protein MAG458_00016 [Nitrosopumilus sp.]|nr:hypothetical protein [Nitrosopumilus sp.]